MYTIISTPIHRQRNNNLFVLALHVSTTMGHLQVLQTYAVNIGRFFIGKYVNTINEKARHTRNLKKAKEIISRKSLMKRNLHNDAFFQ
jgi:hypothetical protein